MRQVDQYDLSPYFLLSDVMPIQVKVLLLYQFHSPAHMLGQDKEPFFRVHLLARTVQNEKFCGASGFEEPMK